jgi:hypothetical protein
MEGKFMIRFGFILSFVLLMVNAGLLVAGTQGVITTHISDVVTDTNATATLATSQISVSPSSSTGIESFLVGIIDFAKQIINIIVYILFGYVILLQNILAPLGLGWVGTMLSVPLVAVQTITLFYLLAEVKRLLPFQS